MYIGKLSEVTGASIKAIRFYEEIGLLNNIKRAGKYRVYNKDHIALVRLIIKAKSLGFTLSQMKKFVERERHASPWHSILEMITQRIADINDTIIQLEMKKEHLSEYRTSILDCLENNPSCALEDAKLDSPLIGRL
ncbi:MerR family transcriptional regulator [Grimontia marina]|uniref:HTH-type transcriptional regulator HmrR n=1 Tax=Grimontia marina TaxID=646534 RepID=A0A128F9B2_9GAMM|nr:MerR family transcriptional regulator [Grimontia marina]CZF83369.1 HTH-type transcriptional regulator HmrR [Grimontia marina]